MAEGLWVLWQEVGVRKESRHQDKVTEADAHTILWTRGKRMVLAICLSYLILPLWGPPKLEINHLISMDIKIVQQ